MRKIPVTLTNRHAIFPEDLSERTSALLDEYWSFTAPNARFSRAHQLYLREKQRQVVGSIDPVAGWDGKIRFFRRGCVPSGLFRATRKDIKEKLGIRFICSKDLPRVRVKPVPLPTAPKYTYQTDCIAAMARALPKGGGIVLSATGTGKTAIAGGFFKLVTVPCLFVVDLVNLLYQSQAELSQWLGEPVGVVGDQTYDVQRVTVATIQTLHRHIKDKKFMQWYRKVKIVVIDELHEQMSRRNFKVLDKIAPVARYGLTATLQMGQKPVRYKAWAFTGPVLFTFPYAEGREKKVLTAGKCVQLLFPEINSDSDTQPKAVTEKFGAFDFHAAVDEEVVYNPAKLNACVGIVEALLRAGRYVIIIVSRVAHIKILQDVFEPTPHRAVYGAIKKGERDKALSMFEAGTIKLLITNVVFKKGVNIKRVDAIIDMAEMSSKNDAVQKFGRGVRLHAQKQDLLYIDFGTQHGRFFRNAKYRANALKASDIPVVRHLVTTARAAIKTIKRCL